MIEAKLSKSGKTLTISTGKLTTFYDVTPLEPHPNVAKKAYRLKKDDGVFWDVRLYEFGISCDCPDAELGNDPCKHAQALVIVKLMPDVLPKARMQ